MRVEQAVRGRGEGAWTEEARLTAVYATNLQRLDEGRRVDLAVLKSVSGHLTNDMVEHYSTISGDEQRASIGKVIDLMEARAARETKTSTEPRREAAL